MYHCSRGRSAINAGRGARWGLLLAVTIGFSAACDSDDDADPGTNVGGSGARATGAAGAGNPLRGEGFEPTPAFDITNPDREPPSRDEVLVGVGSLTGMGGGGSSTPAPADAGSADGGDAS